MSTPAASSASTGAGATADAKGADSDLPPALTTHYGDEAPTVGWITKKVVANPGLCASGWLFLALAFSGLGLGVIGGEAETFFEALGISEFRPLSDPIVKHGLAYSDVVSNRFQGLKAAREDEDEDEDDPDREEDERAFTLDSSAFIYEDLEEANNMLTEANIAKVVAVETTFMEVDWEDVCRLTYSTNSSKKSKCASPITILNYLYRNDDKHKSLCEAGYCSFDRDTALAVCGSSGAFQWGTFPCTSNAFDWRDGKLAKKSEWGELLEKNLCKPAPFFAQQVLDKTAYDCDGGTVKSKYLKSTYSTGWPLKGYKNRDQAGQRAELSPTLLRQPPEKYGSRRRAALEETIDGVSATPSEATRYVGQPQGEDRTINCLWDEFFGLSGRLADTFISDTFLAIASMIFVFIYIWTNVGSIFIAICGILEIILSLPMALAFWRVIMQQEKLDTLFFLSVYLILCIGADDIFVFMDSWKLSASMPAVISGSYETRLSWTYKQAASAMLTTTSTTVLCLLLTTTSALPALRAFGIFVGLVVLFDYLLVITWLPCCVVFYTKYIEKCCPSCGPCCKADGLEEGVIKPERKTVVFLRDRVAPAMFKFRFHLLALSSCVTVAMLITLATQFEVASDLPYFLVPDHPMSVASDISRLEFFSPEAGDYQITVVYGVDPEDAFSFRNTGAGQINPFAVEDIETEVQYVPNFDLNAELQEAIVEDCEHAKYAGAGSSGGPDDNGRLVDNKEVYCILNDLKLWAGGKFPYKDEKALVQGVNKFLKSSLFGARSDKFEGYARKTGIVVEDGDVVALFNTFNTTIPTNVRTGVGSLRPHYERWEAFIKDECAFPCFQYMPASRNFGADWTTYAILARLGGETVTTICASLACAFVVLLLATQNVVIACMVIVTIIAAIVSMLACIFAAGLTFGPNEALYTVLTIGLSIDYAVHIAHFYEHSPGTRFEKAQASLSKIAVSVAGGAATTVFAGMPLFGCSQLGLFLFGFFIFFTSFWAFVMTFTMLVPMLMAFGPEGETGNLRLMIHGIIKGDRAALAAATHDHARQSSVARIEIPAPAESDPAPQPEALSK